jgi:NAD(P)-dependent dehydrogenase (short-subunit alcohol dehydrogenase family)
MFRAAGSLDGAEPKEGSGTVICTRRGSGTAGTQGAVSTQLWLGQQGVAASVSAAKGVDPDDVAHQAVKDTATGRFTTPEEVADLNRFLASTRVSNVTGRTISSTEVSPKVSNVSGGSPSGEGARSNRAPTCHA